MNPMSTKVSVGSSAAAGSVGVPVVVIWLLGLFHVPVPPEVAAVLSGWLASAAALFFGWLVHEMNLPPLPDAATAPTTGVLPRSSAVPPPMPQPAAPAPSVIITPGASS